MNRAATARSVIWLALAVFLAATVPARAQNAPAGTCRVTAMVLGQAIAALALDVGEADAVRQFYRGRSGDCAWSDDRLQALRATLSAASDQGLDPKRYRADDVAPLSTASSEGARVTGDILATAMALRYAHDLVFGRVDIAKIEHDTDAPRPAEDLTAQLDQALRSGDVGGWLARLPPADPAYRRLVQALRRYRDGAVGAETPIVAAGPVLKMGERDARVATLKLRLRELGDLRDPTAGPSFDAPTKAALAAFQRRVGIADTGRLTRDTVAALNVPDEARRQQIAANLERWRYLGHVLAARRIEVNTAAATATLIERYRVVLTMRAVVGDRRHPSPIVVSPGVDAIVLNPPWIVPNSIVAHEIEPRLGRDPGYLARNRMHWIGGKLVQTPGPRNALGRVKFDFPSRFSVYLHDTPARTLFLSLDRARSHGCIRLQRPFELAVALLKSQPQWSAKRLQDGISTGVTQRIPLSDGPQVAVLYWTAFVDEDGTLEFRDDLYRRDARLEAAIAQPSGAPPRTPIAAADFGCAPNG